MKLYRNIFSITVTTLLFAMISISNLHAGLSDDIIKAAQKGSAEAQYNLGLKYYKGDGTVQNYEESIKWFRKSAVQDYIPALLILGKIFSQGIGTPQNFQEAIKWYEKGAELGNATAQFELGNLHYNSRYKKNYEEAVKWINKAAIQNYDDAYYPLAFLTYTGRGTPRNVHEAIKWYEKAVLVNETEAMYVLGDIYENDNEINTDLAKAHKLYKMAADWGHAYAQEEIGDFYYSGTTIPRDYSNALEWYTKSAKQGNASAAKSKTLLEQQISVQLVKQCKDYGDNDYSLKGDYDYYPDGIYYHYYLIDKNADTVKKLTCRLPWNSKIDHFLNSIEEVEIADDRYKIYKSNNSYIYVEEGLIKGYSKNNIKKVRAEYRTLKDISKLFKVNYKLEKSQDGNRTVLTAKDDKHYIRLVDEGEFYSVQYFEHNFFENVFVNQD